MNNRYLYRGVNQKMYQSSKGLLRPKQTTCAFTKTYKADGSIKADGGATAGPSIQNAVLGHQLNSENFPTSGISTTPIFERAKHYATNEGRCSIGYVFMLDRELFRTFKVKEYVVSEWVQHPTIPEDNEVILVAENLAELPLEVVVDIIEVHAQRDATPDRQ
jgi:hypothetical protein